MIEKAACEAADFFWNLLWIQFEGSKVEASSNK